MAEEKTGPGTTLRIRRTFNAPRDKVFKAWTDPKALMQWFAPSDDFSVPDVQVDLRVGGQYRIHMKSSDGESHIVKGAYREVVIPEKLVYTWAWEGGGCGSEGMTEARPTLVTVEFHDNGKTTDVTLTHAYFPDEETKEKHNQGWTGCLNRLAKLTGKL